MKVGVILIIINALDTVGIRLVKGMEEWEIRETLETLQATALLRSNYWEESRRLAITQTPVRRTPANVIVKNTQRRKTIYIYIYITPQQNEVRIFYCPMTVVIWYFCQCVVYVYTLHKITNSMYDNSLWNKRTITRLLDFLPYLWFNKQCWWNQITRIVIPIKK